MHLSSIHRQRTHVSECHTIESKVWAVWGWCTPYTQFCISVSALNYTKPGRSCAHWDDGKLLCQVLCDCALACTHTHSHTNRHTETEISFPINSENIAGKYDDGSCVCAQQFQSAPITFDGGSWRLGAPKPFVCIIFNFMCAFGCALVFWRAEHSTYREHIITDRDGRSARVCSSVNTANAMRPPTRL